MSKIVAILYIINMAGGEPARVQEFYSIADCRAAFAKTYDDASVMTRNYMMVCVSVEGK